MVFRGQDGVVAQHSFGFLCSQRVPPSPPLLRSTSSDPGVKARHVRVSNYSRSPPASNGYRVQTYLPMSCIIIFIRILFAEPLAGDSAFDKRRILTSTDSAGPLIHPPLFNPVRMPTGRMCWFICGNMLRLWQDAGTLSPAAFKREVPCNGSTPFHEFSGNLMTHDGTSQLSHLFPGCLHHPFAPQHAQCGIHSRRHLHPDSHFNWPVLSRCPLPYHPPVTLPHSAPIPLIYC